MCRLFRDYLTQKGFVEIHTPKIISGKSMVCLLVDWLCMGTIQGLLVPLFGMIIQGLLGYLFLEMIIQGLLIPLFGMIPVP